MDLISNTLRSNPVVGQEAIRYSHQPILDDKIRPIMVVLDAYDRQMESAGAYRTIQPRQDQQMADTSLVIWEKGHQQVPQQLLVADRKLMRLRPVYASYLHYNTSAK